MNQISYSKTLPHHTYYVHFYLKSCDIRQGKHDRTELSETYRRAPFLTSEAPQSSPFLLTFLACFHAVRQHVRYAKPRGGRSQFTVL